MKGRKLERKPAVFSRFLPTEPGHSVIAPGAGYHTGSKKSATHPDRAVEQALERIRRSPGAEWEMLSPEERAGLKAALTGIWENCGRDRWEQYCFSTLTKLDLLTLIALVSGMQGRHDPTCGGKKKEVEAILLSCNRDLH